MNGRIQKIIDYLSLSDTNFANEIGITRSRLSHVLSARNKVSSDVIIKILTRFTQFSADWLLLGKGQMLKDTEPNLFTQLDSSNNNDTNTNNTDNNPEQQEVTIVNKQPVNKSKLPNVNNDAKKSSLQNNTNKPVQNVNKKETISIDSTTTNDSIQESNNNNLNNETSKQVRIENSAEQILILFDDNTFKTYLKRN